MLLDLQRAVDGVKYDFDFSIDIDTSIYDGREVKALTPLTVEGYYIVQDDVVNVIVDITVDVESKCDRCLKKVTINHTAELDVLYDKIGEDGTYLYQGYTIDLKDAVNEALTFTFPSLLLCKEDCKGLCPYCGQDLNQKECQCNQIKAEKSNPFSILKEQLRR